MGGVGGDSCRFLYSWPLTSVEKSDPDPSVGSGPCITSLLVPMAGGGGGGAVKRKMKNVGKCGKNAGKCRKMRRKKGDDPNLLHCMWFFSNTASQ